MSRLRQRPAPPSLVRVGRRVEEDLIRTLTAERDRWVSFHPGLAGLFDPLTSLVMAGGKRLRPAFCHWGFVGAGGDPEDTKVVRTGVALELLQAFALLHDDVMDGSARRRGSVTAHLAAERCHRQAGWRGEPRRFGEGAAILVGDLAHVLADARMAAAPSAAQALWAELRIELNVGQYLDIVATAQASTDRDQARLIARYKSGKYTIERPLQLGAALIEPTPPASLMASLSAYGDPLGEVFQLRDDLLGTFGDESITGKPVGDDLREGKPTPLLAAAVERAGPTGPAAEVLATVGRPDLSRADVSAVQHVFLDTGAVAEMESTIEGLTDRAVDAIETADVTAEAREALTDLALYVAWRDK